MIESKAWRWNEVAVEALRVDFSTRNKDDRKDRYVQAQPGPAMSSRALAIIHLAIHDGYYALKDRTRLWSKLDVGATTGDPTVSMAGAAYTALVALYPAQEDPTFKAALAGVDQQSEAFKLGVKAGEAVLQARRFDPTNASRYFPLKVDGSHNVDWTNPTQGFDGPSYGQSTPFAAHSGHRLDPHPALKSQGYKDALDQVIKIGVAVGSTRTQTETDIGTFWAYDGAVEIGTPPRLYNQILRKLVEEKFAAQMTEQNCVDLLTLFNVAMGDAAIFAWREKYRFEFWRPVLGAGKVVDKWTPLGSPRTNLKDDSPDTFTPNFPAYPSGHATFGGAAFHVLRRFLVEKFHFKDAGLGFQFKSDEVNGTSKPHGSDAPRREVTRTYDSLAQIIHENARSRLYLGVHWVFDSFDASDDNASGVYKQNVGGVPLGLSIAEDIFARYTHGQFKVGG
jgi:vanadium chloroperoxidase